MNANATMTPASKTPKTRKPSGPRHHAAKLVRLDPFDETCTLALPPLDHSHCDDVDRRHAEVWEEATRLQAAASKLRKRIERIATSDAAHSELLDLADARVGIANDELILRRAIEALAPDVLETINVEIGKLVDLNAEDEQTARRAAVDPGLQLDPGASLDRFETPERAARVDRMAALRSLHRAWSDARSDSIQASAVIENAVETWVRRWAATLGI